MTNSVAQAREKRDLRKSKRDVRKNCSHSSKASKSRNRETKPGKGGLSLILHLGSVGLYSSPLDKTLYAQAFSKIKVVPRLESHNFQIIPVDDEIVNFDFRDDDIWPRVAASDFDMLTFASEKKKPKSGLLGRFWRNRLSGKHVAALARQSSNDCFFSEELVDSEWSLVSQKKLYKEILSDEQEHLIADCVEREISDLDIIVD